MILLKVMPPLTCVRDLHPPSIIETCKANNVNTYNYLRYLFENIHKAKSEKELRAILPYNLDTSDLAQS